MSKKLIIFSVMTIKDSICRIKTSLQLTDNDVVSGVKQVITNLNDIIYNICQQLWYVDIQNPS